MNTLIALVARGNADEFYNKLPPTLNLERKGNGPFTLDSKTILKSIRSLEQSTTLVKSSLYQHIPRFGDYWFPSLIRLSRNNKLIDIGNDYISITQFCLDILDNISICIGGKSVHRLAGASLLAYLHLYKSNILDSCEKNLHIPIDILFKSGIPIVSLQFHSVDLIYSINEAKVDALLNVSNMSNFTAVNNHLLYGLKLPKDTCLVILEYISPLKSKILYYSIMKGVPLDLIKNSELGQEETKIENIASYYLVDFDLRNNLTEKVLNIPYICSSHKELSIPLVSSNEEGTIIQEFSLTSFNGLVAQFFYYVSARNRETNECVLLDIITESSLITNGVTGPKLSGRDTLETDKLTHGICVPTIPIHTITYANPNLFSTRNRFVAYSKVCVNLDRVDQCDLKLKFKPISTTILNNPVIHIGTFWLNTLICKDGCGCTNSVT